MKLWGWLVALAASAVICNALSERGTSSPRLINGDAYIAGLMQELVYGMEEYGWWNFKMLDVPQILDERMYNWHVSGTVNYTNGFVVSIQKIDVNSMQHTVSSRTVNETVEMTATLRAAINLRDVRVGFDAVVNLDDQPQQTYTGVFTHTLISIQIFVVKNMNTKQYTVTASPFSLSAGSGVRMIYLPVTHVTQVISRRYVPSNNWNSIRSWCNDIIQPILQELAEKSVFPEVCFGC